MLCLVNLNKRAKKNLLVVRSNMTPPSYKKQILNFAFTQVNTIINLYSKLLKFHEISLIDEYNK